MGPPGRRRQFGGLSLAVQLAATAVVLWGCDVTALDSRGDQIRIVVLAVLLAIFLPTLFVGTLSRNLRSLLIWTLLLGVLFTGYTAWQQHRLDITALTTELFPQRPATRIPGEARVRAKPGGDFVVRGTVNDVPVTFLVDTGASEVVLSRADARRVGIDPETLDYVRRFRTANGTVFGAPIRLREVAVGDVRVAGVRGSVTDSDLEISLLGMSFINRLSGFELSRGILTMRE